VGDNRGLDSIEYSKPPGRLQALGIKYGTDKATIIQVCNAYEVFIGGKAVKCLMEVGVCHGSSVRMWAEYFPEAKVVGIDINPTYQVNEGRIKSFIADQGNVSTIIPLVREYNPDIFVDDGSHIWSHQINTHKAIYPILKPGAIYILEDINTSLPIYPQFSDIKERPLDYMTDFLDKNKMRYHVIDNMNPDMHKRSICVIMEKPL
jgi:hypothetical protein